VLYESPHRLAKTLEQMQEFFGKEREVCVAREISKYYETYHRGTLEELAAYFVQTPPKGEIVVVIKGVDL
jgi:16S rRNA (cytidine1402-2'-O)-methyltransferase